METEGLVAAMEHRPEMEQGFPGGPQAGTEAKAHKATQPLSGSGAEVGHWIPLLVQGTFPYPLIQLFSPV